MSSVNLEKEGPQSINMKTLSPCGGEKKKPCNVMKVYCEFYAALLTLLQITVSKTQSPINLSRF